MKAVRREEIKERREWNRRALSSIVKLNNITGFLPLDIDSTLKSIVNEVSNLFNLHTACIYIIEEGMLNLFAFNTSDGLSPDIHLSSSMDACAALRHGLPFVACNSENYRLICQNRKITSPGLSHICIPLLTGSDINGVFSVSFTAVNRLSREEMDVLFSIANQASMTIHRHRLFETLKRERLEMEEAYKEISFLNELLSQKIEELQEARFKLLQSEKLVAIGELAAGLCHEINNPLSIIQNRIECLKMEAAEFSLPQTVLKDLEVVQLYAMKASSIVKDLLSERIEIEDLPDNLRSHGLDGGKIQRTLNNNTSNPLPYREAKEAWLATFEKNYLQSLLESTSVNISRAAEMAGINRKTIHRLIKRYNLDLKRSRN